MNSCAGDFWFFAVRTATRSIEPLDFAPPQGIQHHYARLAVITWKRKQGGTGFEVERLCDCRPLFPPLTQQIQLVYVGGDGQEAMPGQQLCGPLAVRLTNGGTAVGGASVKFAVFEPPPGYDGKLITPEMSGLEVIAPTDDQGLAQCNWQLGKSLAAVCQHVRATLLDCQGNERPPSLLFQAKLSIASEVANVSRCPVIAGDATVQDALNTLCAKVADEPGIHVRQVILGATNEPLRNDAIVRPDELQKGVLLLTDGEVDPVSVSRCDGVHIRRGAAAVWRQSVSHGRLCATHPGGERHRHTRRHRLVTLEPDDRFPEQPGSTNSTNRC